MGPYLWILPSILLMPIFVVFPIGIVFKIAFSSSNMAEGQYLFASALLATIPVVILFMFIEKHLVSELISGGVKG